MIPINLQKVKSGEIHSLPADIVVGNIRVPKVGISCFQDIHPYNTLGYARPVPYAYQGHKGVDFATLAGHPIYAYEDMTLLSAIYLDDTGNMITIQYKDYYIRLMHLRELPQKMTFKKGEIITYTGNTGRSTGPHLHIDIKRKGVYVDVLSSDLVRLQGVYKLSEYRQNNMYYVDSTIKFFSNDKDLKDNKNGTHTLKKDKDGWLKNTTFR